MTPAPKNEKGKEKPAEFTLPDFLSGDEPELPPSVGEKEPPPSAEPGPTATPRERRADAIEPGAPAETQGSGEKRRPEQPPVPAAEEKTAALVGEQRRADEALVAAPAGEKLPPPGDLLDEARRRRIAEAMAVKVEVRAAGMEEGGGEGEVPPATEPVPDSSLPGSDERYFVLEHLWRVRRALTLAEFREQARTGRLLSAGQRRSTEVAGPLAELAERGLVTRREVGGVERFWHPAYRFRPDWRMLSFLPALKLRAVESAAQKNARRYLKGWPFRKEHLDERQLFYLPLWRGYFEQQVEKRHLLLLREKETVKGSLYFEGVHAFTCRVHRKKGVEFARVFEEPPAEIPDFDDFGEWEEVDPGTVGMDERLKDRQLGEPELRRRVRHKYAVEWKRVRRVLLPYWVFWAVDKKSSQRRRLCLDGVFGRILTLASEEMLGPLPDQSPGCRRAEPHGRD